MLSFLVVLSTFVTDRVESVRNRDDEGATAVEYGLMVALIAVAIIVAVTALGGTLSAKFDDISGAIQNATP